MSALFLKAEEFRSSQNIIKKRVAELVCRFVVSHM
jgi:hypothetical protein